MSEEPPKAFVVAYEYGSKLDHLTIPAEVLRRAERELDEARERRRLAAEAEQAAIEASAARKGWRGRLVAICNKLTNFRRGRRT